jgi:signal transduction histidine kinase
MSERLLIVDDEPVVIELIEDILSDSGFTIVSASTVAGGLRLLDEEPSVAILDKNLPDGSGLAILDELRKRWPMSEAIVFTGYASYESVVDALRLGAYDYLGKPLQDIEELRRKVHLALERRRFRQERERTLVELQEAHRLQAYAAHSQTMAQLGRMLAGIVHDLRSPLTWVRGEIEMALQRLRGRPGTEAEVERLRRALEGCDQLATITADVRRVSAVDGHARNRSAPVSVAELVRNATNLTGSETRYRAQVVVTHDDETLTVDGSAVRLTQVLVNLMLNAADAIGDRGTITIRSGAREGRARIEIEDDGCGIPLELQARIFEPFFTTKDADHGTGLGLALSREIAREHGGNLTVRSQPGRTVFLLDLPERPR